MNKEFECFRMEVWLRAWCDTARSNSCVKKETATSYADECLRQFDKRFRNISGGKDE